MDQQNKLVYIVFSIILTLIVVGSLALFFFLPQQGDLAVDAADTGTNQGRVEQLYRESDPSSWFVSSDETPVFSPQEEMEDEFTLLEPSREPVTIMVIEQEETPELRSVPSARDLRTPPAPVRRTAPQAAPAPEAPAARRTPSTPASGQQAPAAPRTVQTTEYWIQAGSFTSRTRAENSRDDLKQRGFAGIISSRTIDGVNFYRLRIGPYTNKNEAEKFLGWLRDVEPYTQSYISEVYVQKTL